MVRACICCKYRLNKSLSDVSLFGFPKDNELLKKWLSVIGPERKIRGSSRVCSRHFKEDDFRYSIVGGTRFLKPGAIPSLNLNGEINNDEFSDNEDAIANESQSMKFMDDCIIADSTKNEMLNITQSHVEAIRKNDQSPHIIAREQEMIMEDMYKNTQFESQECYDKLQSLSENRLAPPLSSQNEQKEKRKKFLYDVQWEEISTSPVQAKIYWEVAIDKIRRQKMVIKSLRQRVKRLKGRILELQSLVKNIRNNSFQNKYYKN